MHHLLPTLADLTNLPWVAIIAISGAFLVTIVIAALGIIFGTRHNERRQAMWHETARIALEKGQPLPPLPDDMRGVATEDRPRNDFRAGLILFGVGAGIYLFFTSFGLHNLRFAGAIPGFIGVALLLYATLNTLLAKRPDDRSPRP